MKTQYFGIDASHLRVGKGNWQFLWLRHWHSIEFRLGWFWIEFKFRITSGRTVGRNEE